MTKQYNVAGFNLYFPDDHLLERYQSTWHLYDRTLGIIAKAVSTKYPNMTAIDIGANVGDSAALIQEFQPIPTLCVEGNPEYLQYLEENSKIIGNVEIADYFIGDEDASIALDAVESHGGTTSIINSINAEGFFISQLRSFQSLLIEFPLFKGSKLFKIDTDGFDFKIIKASQKFIRNSQPIVYFEYDISFAKDGSSEGLSVIELLMDLGYVKFAIYDNFGNHLINLSSQDKQIFFDLTNYLFSSRHESGQPVIYYFDICAFPEVDLDIFQSTYPSFTLKQFGL
ncbi:MAG: FkbM family methyltransferase [Leptolyngbyaceae cyanobacterium bins.302]|nr:FkbM family methyltransferase [Leptolyngbyaceae cyanobacterium bins.302]